MEAGRLGEHLNSHRFILQIGSGHVVRCLTLAEALKDLGADVSFITSEQRGNINAEIVKKGFKIQTLNLTQKKSKTSGYANKRHQNQTDQCEKDDALATLEKIAGRHFDFIIIDHYGLGIYWQKALRPFTRKILVIDDLANRKHDCDILLDQNYSEPNRYHRLVSPDSIQLVGPKYNLLRDEFFKIQQRINRTEFSFFLEVRSKRFDRTSIKNLK